MTDRLYPPTLRLALSGSTSAPRQACVKSGDKLPAGALLATAKNNRIAPLRAPLAGSVSELDATFCTIEVANNAANASSRAPDLPPLTANATSVAELLNRLEQAGVVGLGGAGFPTAKKIHLALQSPARRLIINGCECEPGVRNDEQLLLDALHDFSRGMTWLSGMLQPQQTFIACNAPIARILASAPQLSRWLRQVPDQPAIGAERLLLQALGISPIAGKRPAQCGILVLNVATVVAISRAIAGAALTSRYITLIEPMASRVVEVPFGTKLSDFLALTGHKKDAQLIRINGTLSGEWVEVQDQILGAGCIAVTVSAKTTDRPAPCIRCGHCADICPVHLQPQELLRSLRHDRTVSAVQNCIECGHCDPVCPSSLPLLATFRDGKQAWSEQLHKQTQAEHARQRFAAKQSRSQAEAEHEDQLRRKRLQTLGAPLQ